MTQERDTQLGPATAFSSASVLSNTPNGPGPGGFSSWCRGEDGADRQIRNWLVFFYKKVLYGAGWVAQWFIYSELNSSNQLCSLRTGTSQHLTSWALGGHHQAQAAAWPPSRGWRLIREKPFQTPSRPLLGGESAFPSDHSAVPSFSP